MDRICGRRQKIDRSGEEASTGIRTGYQKIQTVGGRLRMIQFLRRRVDDSICRLAVDDERSHDKRGQEEKIDVMAVAYVFPLQFQ